MRKSASGVLKISYSWKNKETGSVDIPYDHADALHETAQEQIGVALSKGITSGDLVDNIHMNEHDPDEGVDYIGEWKLD